VQTHVAVAGAVAGPGRRDPGVVLVLVLVRLDSASDLSRAKMPLDPGAQIPLHARLRLAGERLQRHVLRPARSQHEHGRAEQARLAVEVGLDVAARAMELQEASGL